MALTEYLVSIKIEKLEEGVYLATSDNLQGLVAQGRTIAETMEIAQNPASNSAILCQRRSRPPREWSEISRFQLLLAYEQDSRSYSNRCDSRA